MANPTLERQFGRMPSPGSTDAVLDQGPIVSSGQDSMTIGGVSAKTAFLMMIVLGAGAWGWSLIEPRVFAPIPAWWFAVLIGAFVLAIVTTFKPRIAVVTGPIYAAVQGVMLGAISHIYDARFEGIVLQAILATAAVFFVMLVLFVTRTIKVTNRLRGVIVGATFGIMLFYLASIGLALFGATMPLIWDSGPIGIGFSVLIVGVAAFNLMLDFDYIERGVAARAPQYLEWFAAFGLMVTVVWLYLELLRLLGKVRN